MTSCSCGGDMNAYGAELTYCPHCDASHAVGQCPSCIAYQRATNERTRQ
jgi:hypothetical protein